eukprot:scaffold187421_cov17-Tisochrysis_lutea.AAC.1
MAIICCIIGGCPLASLPPPSPAAAERADAGESRGMVSPPTAPRAPLGTGQPAARRAAMVRDRRACNCGKRGRHVLGCREWLSSSV